MKILMICLTGCLLAACGSSPEEADPVKAVKANRLAGRVQTVNKASGFVLIRRYGPWRVGQHEVVVSQAEGRSANLLPSGEKLGEHIAADIQSGDVEVGDAVYIRQMAKNSESLTTKESRLSGNPKNIPPPENKVEEAEKPKD